MPRELSALNYETVVVGKNHYEYGNGKTAITPPPSHGWSHQFLYDGLGDGEYDPNDLAEYDDYDRWFNVTSGGLRPGGLLGSGNLVGPAHPLFHPSPGGHFGGGLPQGVPPGARFDPFLPPGIMPRGGFGGGGRGRGGGGIGGGFGPNPNHLRPPPDDEDAPPDIYY